VLWDDGESRQPYTTIPVSCLSTDFICLFIFVSTSLVCGTV
jgi:hypothetical protein